LYGSLLSGYVPFGGAVLQGETEK